MSVITPSVTPLLSDIITYVRRIIKQPNEEDVSDDTISDYVNRFYIYDMPARIQILDLKARFNLELSPNIDQYNAPITYLPNGVVIPTFNSYLTPAYIDGYQIVMQQSHDQWFKLFPNRMENGQFAVGNGFQGPYNFNFDNIPVVRGHRDQNIKPNATYTATISNVTPGATTLITAVNNFSAGQFVNIIGVVGVTGGINGGPFIITAATAYTFTIALATGGAYVSGGIATVFVQGNIGLLESWVYVTAQDANGITMIAQDDGAGNLIGDVAPTLAPPPSNTVNYLTGAISVNFVRPVAAGVSINAQFIPYSAGRPQAVLLYDNTFSFRPIPDRPYLFQIDAYYNPAAFLSTEDSVPYRWMAEYFARGTARKILTDYGDAEQLAFYEPYFREQENFVLRRTTRQNSNVRTATIYQGQTSYNPGSYNAI